MQPEQQFYDIRNSNVEPRAFNTDHREEKIDPYGYAGQQQNPQRQPQRLRRRRPRYLGVLVLLVFLLAVGGLINRQLSATSISSPLPAHTFTLTGRSSLHVKNTHGYVHIHQGATNAVVVAATKHTPNPGAFLDNLQVDYAQNGNTSTVQVEGSSASFLFDSASIDLDITVPSASDLDIYDASGPIIVEDVNGQIRAETGSGDVTLQNVRLQGASVLHTGSGDIQFNGRFVASGNYKLESGSGSIDLRLPSDSALLLTTHTSSGRNIQNDFNTDSIGTSPQALISISTGSGAIHIYKQ
ncbi:DUF4097 family beta strand repeat-containing protein [Ktedonobacter racemifer]|uniref:DUF4097 domain-containing protein n=1 Tax=Ktedonobacter racemifer DSM 44963 TaxID=485913 RepID=D6U482_KTERA|nr:DUF4097 family beta strand repeat-containing protein [Ktedonobacter racemifer]EFH81312.1 hypothetical protein Krac_2027 [Ktedonobacter racemifer DSM 44963]